MTIYDRSVRELACGLFDQGQVLGMVQVTRSVAEPSAFCRPRDPCGRDGTS